MFQSTGRLQKKEETSIADSYDLRDQAKGNEITLTKPYSFVWLPSGSYNFVDGSYFLSSLPPSDVLSNEDIAAGRVENWLLLLRQQVSIVVTQALGLGPFSGADELDINSLLETSVTGDQLQ